MVIKASLKTKVKRKFDETPPVNSQTRRARDERVSRAMTPQIFTRVRFL